MQSETEESPASLTGYQTKNQSNGSRLSSASSWAVSAVFALFFVALSGADQIQSKPENAPPAARPTGDRATPAKPPLKANPVSMDFGFLAPNTPGVGTVELRNTSDSPLTIELVQPSCKCTTINDLAGRVIAPGEAVGLEIKLDGAPAMGVRRSSVKIIVAGFARPLDISIKGEVSMPVRTVPAYINAVDNKNLTGRFVVESIDRKPFRILSTRGAPVTFDAPVGVDSEPKSTYIVSYDLTELVGAMPGFVYFETDSPGAAVVDIRVRNERTVKPVSIRMQDMRCNIGLVQVGIASEAKFTVIDPLQSVESVATTSKDASVELVRTEKGEGRNTIVIVKVTPMAGVKGLLVVPITLHSKGASQEVEVIASVKP